MAVHLHREIDGLMHCPDRARTLIDLLSVSRQLERIADLTTNIAEEVVYMVKGEIMRHHALPRSQ